MFAMMFVIIVCDPYYQLNSPIYAHLLHQDNATKSHMELKLTLDFTLFCPCKTGGVSSRISPMQSARDKARVNALDLIEGNTVRS